MSAEEHRASSPTQLRVALVTISDTRTEATDTAGKAARALIEAAGHTVTAYRILRDEPVEVEAHLRRVCASGNVDAIITAGGTGVSSRDRSFEAVSRVLERELTGFGELFRMLSFAEIGAAAMLSRATAGLAGRIAIFSCPGSEAAVKLALTRLILPELGHVVREARR